MLRSHSRIAAVSLLVLGGLAGVILLEDDRPATKPGQSFSGAEALRHLAVIAAEPRPVGSVAHRRVGDYLLAQIRRTGHRPEEQRTYMARGRFGQFVSGSPIRNILVRLPATNSTGSAPQAGPGGAALFLAHYDSVPTSPGAADDGYGTVALLELLRVAAALPDRRHDLIFLWSDAEERGLLGAEAFVREHRWSGAVRLVINAEARGNSGPAILFETGPDSAAFVRRLIASDRRVHAWSLATAVYRMLPNDTDFSVFRRAGMPGVNFASIENVTAYHTMNDSVANADRRTLQHLGESLVSALQLVLQSPELPARTAVGAGGGHAGPRRENARSDTFAAFRLPFLGTVALGAGWVYGIGALALLATLAFGLVSLWSGRVRSHHAVRATLACILLVGLALVGSALWAWSLPFWNPPYQHFTTGDGYRPGWLRLSVFLFVGALAWRWAIGAHKRFGGLALLLGAVLAWALTLAALLISFADGAYLLAGPLVFLAAGGTLAATRWEHRAWATGVLYALGLLVLVLLVTPVIHLLFVALTLRAALATGGALAFLLLPLLPLLGELAPRATRAGTGLVLGLAVASCVAGVLAERRSTDQPLPAALLHAEVAGGAGSGSAAVGAHWASCLPPDHWTGPLLAGATRRALPEYFPVLRGCLYTRAPFYVARAPAFGAARLTQRVSTATDTATKAEVATITLTLPDEVATAFVFARREGRAAATLSGRQAASEKAKPVRASGGALAFVRVEGVALERPEDPGPFAKFVGRRLGLTDWLTLSMAAPGRQARFSLAVPAGASVRLRVLRQRPGLPGVVPARPPDSVLAGVQPFHDSRLVVEDLLLERVAGRFRLRPIPLTVVNRP